MNTPITVLLVDDHALVRKMLADRLAAEPDIQVVGTAEEADAALVVASDKKPDVILMDVDMPGLACFDAARVLKTIAPKSRIIFLSAFFNDRYIDQALAVEAAGYVTKSEPPESVIAAIRAASAGKSYFSQQVQSRIVVDSGGARLNHPKRSLGAALSNREMETLRYVSQGMSKKEIGQVMHVAVKTVERHCCNLMEKLEIHDRVELARYAIREGISEP